MSLTKDEISKHAKEYINYIESWIISSLYKDFKLSKKQLDWNTKRVSSRGGKYASGYGINIAMKSYKMRTRNIKLVHRLSEYSSFDKDASIGGFFFRDDQFLVLDTIIVHEIAHALQYYYTDTHTLGRSKPHGDIFKKFYKMLRVEFINNRLEDQKKLKDILFKQLKESLCYVRK